MLCKYSKENYERVSRAFRRIQSTKAFKAEYTTYYIFKNYIYTNGIY